MRLRGLRRLSHIAEGLRVHHIHIHARILSARARHETVHEQLRVTHLDGTHNADHTSLRQRRRHRPEHKTTLIGRRRIRKHIRQTERIRSRTPRERGIREVRSDLLQRTAVLRTMSDHQIKPRLRVLTDRHRSILHNERPVGDLHLQLTHLTQRRNTLNDALRERQIIRRRRRHNRHPQRTRRLSRRRRGWRRLIGRRCRCGLRRRWRWLGHVVRVALAATCRGQQHERQQRPDQSEEPARCPGPCHVPFPPQLRGPLRCVRQLSPEPRRNTGAGGLAHPASASRPISARRPAGRAGSAPRALRCGASRPPGR